MTLKYITFLNMLPPLVFSPQSIKAAHTYCKQNSQLVHKLVPQKAACNLTSEIFLSHALTRGCLIVRHT